MNQAMKRKGIFFLLKELRQARGGQRNRRRKKTHQISQLALIAMLIGKEENIHKPKDSVHRQLRTGRPCAPRS